MTKEVDHSEKGGVRVPHAPTCRTTMHRGPIGRGINGPMDRWAGGSEDNLRAFHPRIFSAREARQGPDRKSVSVTGTST